MEALRRCIDNSKGKASTEALETVAGSLVALLSCPAFLVPVDQMNLQPDSVVYQSGGPGALHSAFLNEDDLAQMLKVRDREMRATVIGACLGSCFVGMCEAKKTAMDVGSLLKWFKSSQKLPDEPLLQYSLSVALMVVMKNGPQWLMQEGQEHLKKVLSFLSDLSVSESTVIHQSSIRATAFGLSHLCQSADDTALALQLLRVLQRAVKSDQTNVRYSTILAATHVAWHMRLVPKTFSCFDLAQKEKPLPAWIASENATELILGMFNLLIAGTRDKVGAIRTQSEIGFAIIGRIGLAGSQGDNSVHSFVSQMIPDRDLNVYNSLLANVRRQNWDLVWNLSGAGVPFSACVDLDDSHLV
ncbi:eIF-2-alpha kinase activator GCN1 [Cichlidogyrus casuarinus]|uniref:EIF-2-alpha kinase activator GCN1 n=1 Tax=Cichlidogyrus casuarinus TaxID=1844966 RepID=A0ABD2QLB1_9PLAT